MKNMRKRSRIDYSAETPQEKRRREEKNRKQRENRRARRLKEQKVGALCDILIGIFG